MGYVTSYTLEVKNLNEKSSIPTLQELATMLKTKSAPAEQVAVYLDLLANDGQLDGSQLTEEKVIAILRKTYPYAAYAIDEEGQSNGPVKWYSCEQDLREFSVKFPTALFCVSCLGEEPGDLYRIYIQAGKSYTEKAKIVYNEFNRKNLK